MGYADGESPEGGPSFNNSPQTTADLNRLRDYIEERGNSRKGTSSDRNDLLSPEKQPGLQWTETDTGIQWVVTASGDWLKVYEDTGWAPLSLLNGWAAFGGAYQTPRVRRLNGVVFVEATLRNGAGAGAGRTTPGAVIGQLPVGYRTGAYMSWVVPQDNGSALVEVGPNGNIVVGQLNVSPVRLVLDTIHFPAEQ